MLRKTIGQIMRLLKTNDYGVMVVNSSYYRPLASKYNYDRYMSDSEYFTLCEELREQK